jgi:hypothetical protein
MEEDRIPKTINRRVKNYKGDLERDISLKSRNRLWPNPCMQKKKKKKKKSRPVLILGDGRF